jgi:hypothetical protein
LLDLPVGEYQQIAILMHLFDLEMNTFAQTQSLQETKEKFSQLQH